MTLPEGWRRVRLGDVAETALGKMLDRGRTRGLPQVRYLRNVNVQWGRIDTFDLLTMELGDDERQRFGVEPGDLLVCEGGEIGRAALWRGDGEYIAFQKALHRVRPSAVLDPLFLQYALEMYSSDGTLAALSTGSTIAHLPQQQLRRIPLALPPLREQRCLVEYLEDHFDRLEAGDRVLARAGARANALLASGSAQSTEFAGDAVRLDQLGNIVTGATPSPRDADVTLGGMWFVTPADVGRGDRIRRASRSIDETRAGVRPLRSGAVLTVCIGATLGKVGWTDRPVATNQQINAIEVDDGFAIPEFVAVALSAPKFQAQLKAMASSTTLPILNKSKFSQLWLELPSREQQEVFLRKYGSTREFAVRLQSELEVTRLRGASMRRALLRTALTGQLTGRASDLDRAEELVS